MSALHSVVTHHDSSVPLLPGFSLAVAELYPDVLESLGDEKVEHIKATTGVHLRFMRSKAQAPIIAHLLGPANIALVDGLASDSDVRKSEINQTFVCLI